MARIKIGHLYKLTITVQQPTEVADEKASLSFVGVFRDEHPDAIKSHSENLSESVDVFLKAVKALQADGAKAEIATADLERIEKLKETTPAYERQLQAVEGLEIETADGSLLSDEDVRDYVLRVPRYRSAIEKRFNDSQAGIDATVGVAGNSRK